MKYSVAIFFTLASIALASPMSSNGADKLSPKTPIMPDAKNADDTLYRRNKQSASQGSSQGGSGSGSGSDPSRHNRLDPLQGITIG
ncbi:hypothetical protein HIM_12673 [Hirsutella minnesotensis 3608]|uniref:Uncharacterized protein n=1 Tax=Hirsutella minnesotensis 3608 TaxID=1043627 RepID=A0A0F7ZVW6_9HYPO|nr:hypothetical protein HIM_12673 [Hirsutella minnesotensis 3608]